MKISADELFQTLSKLKKNGFVTLISLTAEELSPNALGEDKFLLTYTLYNPVNKEFKEIETTTNGVISSVSTLYKSANYDEREIYDLFGVKFKNHPNLAKIFLDETNTTVNYPLTLDTVSFSLETKGEKISKCASILGFNHKGFEKVAQDKTFPQYIPLAQKVDFLSEFFYSHAYISAVEELLELELPKNAQYIRVLTMELNRISSHLWWLGRFTQDLGSKMASQKAFELRSSILELLQKITNSEKPCNYYVFGGVKEKISNDILNNISDFTEDFNKKLKIFDTLLTKNPIFIDRTRNTGVITSEIALPYSITGVNLRANGVGFDFRKEKPYLVYNELEFSIPTAFEGDCYSRYKLRLNETEISLNLVKQCAERLLSNADGKVTLNINQTKIRPKAGRVVNYTESPRGLVMCHLTTDGSKKPKRLKWRTPSFYAIQLLEKTATEYTLSDFKTLYSSLDISLSEAER